MTTSFLLPSLSNLSDYCNEWGDLLRFEDIKKTEPQSPPKSSFYQEEDDENIPNLVLRKDIWANFPVVLIPLGRDASGVDRHSVQWHKANLIAGRNEPAFEDYLHEVRTRLIKALKASDRWTVQAASTNELIELYVDPNCKFVELIEKEICILHMTFDEHSEPVSSDSKYTGPILLRLNDIKEHFKVCWNNEKTNNKKIYTIQIHQKNAKAAGIDIEKHKFDLLEALQHSHAWEVIPGEKDEVCRIKLK